MPASTPFLGLYKPGGGSTGLITPDEVVDIDRLNTNADLIDAFAKSYGPATERNHQLYGPASSLGGVSGMKLGDTYQESDGNKVLWKYDGTNWVTGESGMYLIRPTSVTGGLSIDASGNIVGTALANGNLDILGIFSTRFDNYVIEMYANKAGVSGSQTVSGLVGAAPVASNAHFNHSMYSTGADAPSAAQGGGQANFSGIMDSEGTKVAAKATWYSPNRADTTLVTSSNVGRGGQIMTSQKTASLETNDQITGLRLNFGQTVNALRVKVYGLA